MSNLLVRQCLNCGARVEPAPYFSRSVNMLKLVLLGLLNIIIGLIYYMVRRNSTLCPVCNKSKGFIIKADGYQTQQPAAFGTTARTKGLAPGIILSVLGGVILAPLLAGDTSHAIVRLLGSGALLIPGIYFMFLFSTSKKAAAQEKQNSDFVRIMNLAAQNNGVVTVTMVARTLGVDFNRAEEIINSYVDGFRLDMEVDDDGVIRYVFREML